MRNPRSFGKPLAIGAPTPVIDNPVRPSRMIHFFDPSNPRMATKVPDLVKKLDVLLANLEDAIEADNKVAAREGLIEIARNTDFGDAQFWVRVNSLDSPWVLDDLIEIVTQVGDKIDVVMVPKVEGPWDIHYVDQLLAQLEAKGGVQRPILVHAILETALGVANVEEIVSASPRMQGISLGPADLAASRRMKTTRVGGGHPGYVVRVDPDPENEDAPRVTAQQDLWHYTMARMVDACAATGALAYYGPFGDISDSLGCEDQFRNAFLLGCVGAWSLHPKQIDIARRVFSPPPDEVLWAKRVIEEMGDGTGTVMIEGKMQDDATVKQCRVMVSAARMIARRDPEYAEAYQFSPEDLADA
jgi:malyl-CoA/(S)-citramalyl-CoA lyase